MNKKNIFLRVGVFFIFSTVVYFVFMLYGCMEKQYEEEEYYNNYYGYNSGSLDSIKSYISENNLLGYIYQNESVYDEPINHDLLRGDLGNCFYSTNCFIGEENLVSFLKKSNINFIGFKEKDFDGNEIKNLKIKPIKTIYNSPDNFIYYQEGYYKGKQEGESIDGNDMHAIEKIFNDDWGVINGCYGCGGGGWD